MTAATGTDIAIAWDTLNCRGDWAVANNQLLLGNPLVSAIMVSLFTDRVAPPDWIGDDPKGWWGDSYEQEPIGSWLWLLRRAVKSDASALLVQAQNYSVSALQWLIDDGVVASVTVNTAWIGKTALGIIITVAPPAGASQTFAFSWAWTGL